MSYQSWDCVVIWEDWTSWGGPLKHRIFSSWWLKRKAERYNARGVFNTPFKDGEVMWKEMWMTWLWKMLTEALEERQQRNLRPQFYNGKEMNSAHNMNEFGNAFILRIHTWDLSLVNTLILAWWDPPRLDLRHTTAAKLGANDWVLGY